MTDPPIRPGDGARALRLLLAKPGLLLMPCCFDAVSARLVALAGFKATFLSGFAVAGTRLGLPDTGLISYAEMADHGRDVASAVAIPVLGDGDTGYGNALNVKRTVTGYAAAGLASVMIEDQVAPKRCGHTRGKQVVERTEALARMRAAIDARDEVRAAGGDIMVLARTDANATHGFDEALERVCRFADLGADMVFLEAPRDEDQMARFCTAVDVPCLANMLDGGDTPVLPPARLAEMGFRLAAYPLTLLLASIAAMERSLAILASGGRPASD